jgi:hypothetical protein
VGSVFGPIRFLLPVCQRAGSISSQFILLYIIITNKNKLQHYTVTTRFVNELNSANQCKLELTMWICLLEEVVIVLMKSFLQWWKQNWQGRCHMWSRDCFPFQSSPPVFSEVCVARSLVFCVMLCRLWFVLFLLAIVLSVLWFTATNLPFGTFKLFLKRISST